MPNHDNRTPGSGDGSGRRERPSGNSGSFNRRGNDNNRDGNNRSGDHKHSDNKHGDNRNGNKGGTFKPKSLDKPIRKYPSSADGRSQDRRDKPFRSRDGRPDSRRGGGFNGRNGRGVDKPAINARRVALDILLDVTQHDAYAQLALDKHLRQTELDSRDKSFVTRLVYGTIENRYMLDYRIDHVLEKPDDLDPTVREILRLGTYQVLFMDRVPDTAATDESVRLTREMDMEGLTGLVNGVIRNIIREKDTYAWPVQEDDPVRYLSIMCSTPEELCRMLIDRFGFDEASEILRYRQSRPYESIRPNLLRCDAARLRRLLADDEYEFEPGCVQGTYRVYNAGDMTQLRAYQNGLFVIQGESSVLAARAVEAKPGQTVLDACAAPGGKTSLLSEMMNDTGRVYAWDTHPHRVELIRGTAARLHIENIRPMKRDAQEPRPEMASTLDAALVDAPCSGSGVMYIKPDIKYRITMEGLESLARVQASILDAVADMLKPGGILVYSTCSIFPEENEEQIKAFLERHSEFSVYPMGEMVPEALRAHETDTGIQILAHRDNMDGFYICRMKKA